MVSILSLWLPILLSAVFVFVASSIIHMVLTYHRTDQGPVPDEANVMDALRPFNLSPGDYAMPCATDTKAMGTPEFIEKAKQGPVAFLTVLPNGPMTIGKSLGTSRRSCDDPFGAYSNRTSPSTISGFAMRHWGITGTRSAFSFASSATTSKWSENRSVSVSDRSSPPCGRSRSVGPTEFGRWLRRGV